MRRYVIEEENFRSRTKRYDSDASDSSYQPGSFRVRQNCEVRSFGNDIGSQYERPGRNMFRIKKNTQSVTVPNPRYLLGSHGNGAFVYNDVPRLYTQRPKPIIESYETSYMDNEPRYLTLQKMPKFIYKRDRFNSWTQAVRPVETRYFTEDQKARNFAYLNERSSTSNGSTPIVEARYVSENPRVPKLVTDMRCRMMVDASVGRMPARKKVTKIYLPEMRNRGTGSADLSPQIAQLKTQQNQTVATASCGFDTPHLHQSQVFTAKHVPNINLISVNTSAKSRADLTETSAQVSEPTENIDNIPEKLVQHDSEEEITEPMIKSTPGLLDVVSIKSSTIEKEPPSELIKLYDLDNASGHQSTIANILKDEVEREFLKIYTNESNTVITIESKKSIASPIPKLESASEVRRRFEALRKGAVDRDEPSRNNLVSRATSHISFERKHAAVSPGVSPQRSYSSTNMDELKFDYQYSEPSSSPKAKGRRNISDGIYRFKLWGHKRNEIDLKQGKQHNPRKKAETQSRPLKIQESIYAADKKKSRKLFFFSKRSKTKERFAKDNERQRITSARCDVPVVSLKIGGTQYLQKNRAGKQLDTIKNAWLEKFMLGVIDSVEDVHIRWNNNCFKTSSTTVLELMDSVYEGAGVVVKSNSHASEVSLYKGDDKRVNFFQNIEAYMVHKTIHKAYKYRRNLRTSRSNEKWYYDNSKTIARKIELVMTANDITMFRHSTRDSSSSEELRLELPNNFFEHASSEELVSNITEYEDIECISDQPQTKKNVTMDKGDIVIIPIESTADCHEKKKTRRDVVLRDSSMLVPKRCDFISLLMQKTKKRSRNLHSQLQICNDEIRRDNVSTIQEVYRSWLEKLAWFGKDDRSCRSEEVDFHGLRQLYIIEEESSVQSKSCPTLFDCQEYQLLPKLSIVDMTQEAKREVEAEMIETKPRENVAKKITDKIFSIFKKNNLDSAIRILPKDSVAVCKKRMQTAASLRRWQDGDPYYQPCSVPSHADKAGEIQWDIDEIPLLTKKLPQEVINMPASILAEPSTRDKKKNTSKPKIDPIPSGVIPRADKSVDQPSSEVETEIAVQMPASEAESTGGRSMGVYCMPNLTDKDCVYKAVSEKDLSAFRIQMGALGTPLPLLHCTDYKSVATGRDVSNHVPGNVLFQTEYQFVPNSFRNSKQIDQGSSNDEATEEDYKNLEEKLTSLSATTTKSLEVLSQIFQGSENKTDKQETGSYRCQSSQASGTKLGTCGCFKSICDPVCAENLCKSFVKPNSPYAAMLKEQTFGRKPGGILVTGGESIATKQTAIQKKPVSTEETISGGENTGHLTKKEGTSPILKCECCIKDNSKPEKPRAPENTRAATSVQPPKPACIPPLSEKCNCYQGKNVPKSFPDGGCPKCTDCPDCKTPASAKAANEVLSPPMQPLFKKSDRPHDNFGASATYLQKNNLRYDESEANRMMSKNSRPYNVSDASPSPERHFPTITHSAAEASNERGTETSDGRLIEITKLSSCSGECSKFFSPKAKSPHRREVSPPGSTRSRRDSRIGSGSPEMSPLSNYEQEDLELGGRRNDRGSRTPSTKYEQEDFEHGGRRHDRGSRTPSTRYEQEDLEYGGRCHDRGSRTPSTRYEQEDLEHRGRRNDRGSRTPSTRFEQEDLEHGGRCHDRGSRTPSTKYEQEDLAYGGRRNDRGTRTPSTRYEQEDLEHGGRRNDRGARTPSTRYEQEDLEYGGSCHDRGSRTPSTKCEQEDLEHGGRRNDRGAKTPSTRYEQENLEYGGSCHDRGSRTPSTKYEQEDLEHGGRRNDRGTRTPSTKYEQEDLEYGGRPSNKGSKPSSLPSKHKATANLKDPLKSASARDARERKCTACITRPWWLGGGGLPTLRSPAKCLDVDTQSQSPGSGKPSPAPSDKNLDEPSVQSCGMYRSKSKTVATSIYNMVEDRLITLTTEDTEQPLSIRDEFMEKFSKLDMPRIVEIDSKETILVGTKRKTPSTEKIRDPETIRSPNFAIPKSNLKSDIQKKYIPLEAEKDSEQIEISFKVKIGSRVTDNFEHYSTGQRYRAQPEIYVVGNQEDKSETGKAPNDVNIQIIIKPNSRRSEHDLSLNKTHAPKSPTIHNATAGTSRIYSLNRSATELSIHKEESESGLKVKWEPTSEAKSTETSLNSEGSSKEQSNHQSSNLSTHQTSNHLGNLTTNRPANLLSNQRAIKPVSRTVASPFQVMYKTPLVDKEEEHMATDTVGDESPLGTEQFCSCGRLRNDTTQANTHATAGTDSMKNYFRVSSQSDDEIYPSKSSINCICSGPYKERIKTVNSRPKSKLIQTYSKIDQKHSCQCKKSNRPLPVQRFKEKTAAINQCANCDMSHELSSDSYCEVVDTGTQYFKPPSCLMCFVKKRPNTVLEPVDFRMLNVEHPSPNIRNLHHSFTRAGVTSRRHEISRPGTSARRDMVVENRGDFITDEHKLSKRIALCASPMDILQSYEMKKAVLELYAQRQVSQDGERLVAKLPKFVFERETDIDKLADRYRYADRPKSHVRSIKDR